MNAKNIIFGTLALAIVGGGAYFYFKNKNKSSLEKDKLKSLLDLSTSNSNTGTGTTPDKVLDSAPVNSQATKEEIEAKAKLIAKAKDLASKICDAKTQKNFFKNISNYDFCSKYAISGTSCSNITEVEQQKNSRIKSIEKSITSLNKELSLLGYMESNCEISKITI